MMKSNCMNVDYVIDEWCIVHTIQTNLIIQNHFLPFNSKSTSNLLLSSALFKL